MTEVEGPGYSAKPGVLLQCFTETGSLGSAAPRQQGVESRPVLGQGR